MWISLKLSFSSFLPVLPKPQVSYKTTSPGVIEANCTSVSRPPAEIVWNVERDNRTVGAPVATHLPQGDGTTLVISTLTVQSGLLKDVSVKCLVHHKGLETPIAVSMNTKSELASLHQQADFSNCSLWLFLLPVGGDRSCRLNLKRIVCITKVTDFKLVQATQHTPNYNVVQFIIVCFSPQLGRPSPSWSQSPQWRLYWSYRCASVFGNVSCTKKVSLAIFPRVPCQIKLRFKEENKAA